MNEKNRFKNTLRMVELTWDLLDTMTDEEIVEYYKDKGIDLEKIAEAASEELFLADKH